LPLIFQLKGNVAGFREIHKKMLVRLKSGVNSIAIKKGDLNGRKVEDFRHRRIVGVPRRDHSSIDSRLHHTNAHGGTTAAGPSAIPNLRFRRRMSNTCACHGMGICKQTFRTLNPFTPFSFVLSVLKQTERKDL